MSACRLLGALFLVLLALVAGAEQEEVPTLRNNPFQRPDLKAAPTARSPVARAVPVRPPPQPAAAVKPVAPRPVVAKPVAPPPPPWRPQLRGTVTAGAVALANLGGVILAPGEQVDDYVLLEVRPGEALFGRKQRRFLVRLGGATVELPPAPPAAAPAKPAAPQVELEIPPAPTAKVAETVAAVSAAPPTRPSFVPMAARAATAPPPVPATDPPAAVAAPVANAGAGATHVLQVGVYRSQRYLREQEQQLAALGVPHFRQSAQRPGRGYQVAVEASPQHARAQQILAAEGYAFQQTDRGIEVYLYLEDEARRVTGLLAAEGIEAHRQAVQGDLPRWTLLAGPYGLVDAREERDRLAQRGVRSVVAARP